MMILIKLLLVPYTEICHTNTNYLFEMKSIFPTCWPLVPKIAGSIPAEAVGFFGLKNPQHAFLGGGGK